MRVAHAVLGGVVGVVWLVLPGVTVRDDVPVAGGQGRPVASAAAPAAAGRSAVDLVLPLVAVGAAGVLAGYGYVRRTRRARTRTTPGGAPVEPAPSPSAELDGQSQALLVEADDCLRTSREELGFAEARSGAAAVAPFARAVRDAGSELAAAFRMRQQYDDGVPEDDASRRHALAGIVGRCQEAGRRLDAEAAGFDGLRGLEREQDVRAALAVAEARFRELAGRAGSADATLADLGGRYPATAIGPVTGHAEQAKDRLVFATFRLNQARQTLDLGDVTRAGPHLRAAEGAIAQAAVFVDSIDRLAADLTTAAGLVPAALTGAEAEIAGARERWARASAAPTPPASVTPATPTTPTDLPGLPAGELHARILHADVALTAVREELTATGRPYDPLDALRRIVRAVAPLADGRAGVIPAAALLTARSVTALVAGFVGTHRGAVGGPARTRLAEAERLLAPASAVPSEQGLTAGILARQARDLAEQDVRVHGNPVAGGAAHTTGAGGAVLGGILLGGDPDGGPAASFGGPATRARGGPEPT